MSDLKQKTQLERLAELIDDVDQVCLEKGTPSPGAFLATVMSGEDPRPVESELFTLVKRIAFRDLMGGDPFPTKEEWVQVMNIVMGSDAYVKTPLDASMSVRAAEKLMDFLHAKMKAIELSGATTHLVKVEPLSPAEVDLFTERFQDEF